MRGNSMRLYCLGVIASLSFGLLTACGQKDSAKVQSVDFNQTLIRQSNHKVVTLCGDYQQLTAAAITQWAAAIGRAFQFQFAADCSKVKSYALQIIAYGDPKAVALCRAENVTTALSMVDTHVIAFCGYYPPERLLPALLHETGHIWGLCLGEHPDNAQYCGTRLPHIMGGSGYMLTALSPYDFDAIRKLAQENPQK